MSSPAEVTAAVLADGTAALRELALNLHWSWNHAADDLWMALDAGLWETTQNPWVILQTVSKDQIGALLANPVLRKLLDDLVQQNRDDYTKKAWFQEKHPESPLSCVAYFSMEFMLSEALPIYSGGLGNVAGDQMKAASDAQLHRPEVILERLNRLFVLPYARRRESLHRTNDTAEIFRRADLAA